MPQWKRLPNKAELLLSEKIKRLRLQNDMTKMQLAKKLHEKEQQVTKYESGGFVPLATIENIAKIFGGFVPKKIIRKISSLRKLEIKTQIEQEELSALYEEAMTVDDED